MLPLQPVRIQEFPPMQLLRALVRATHLAHTILDRCHQLDIWLPTPPRATTLGNLRFPTCLPDRHWRREAITFLSTGSPGHRKIQATHLANIILDLCLPTPPRSIHHSCRQAIAMLGHSSPGHRKLHQTMPSIRVYWGT